MLGRVVGSASTRRWRARAPLALSIAFALLAPIVDLLVFAPRADAEPQVTTCQHQRRAPRARRTKSARRRARARAPRLTAAQRRQIRRRHARASATEVRSWLRQEPPPLVFLPTHGQERITLSPASDEVGFDADDLALAAQALGTRDGATHEVHPRLVELVYRAVRQFRVPYVHVVSGYREGRATSRHTQGRALDFALPGVSDRRLAAYLRPQGFVGVGIYPVSGFVHLDVRARSHFWSDSSGPSQATRERPMLRAQTARFDAAARRRGVEPLPDAVVTTEGESAEGELTEREEDAVEGSVAPSGTPAP